MQQDWWWYCSDWTLWEIFFLPTPGFELGNSGSLVLHSTTVPWWLSGFHLWQFQVLKSGAEGLVVVLFWLDLWEIFFLPTRGFELGTSGSLVLHSTTVPQWFLVFTSEIAEGLVVLFWLALWEIFFLPTPGFELGTSGSLVLNSTTVWQWFLVFTSNNLRYLTLVQRDWWWHTSDWTCERFSFCPHQALNWGHLDLYSCTLPLWHSHIWFSPLTISGIEVWCRGICGGIVLIGPVRDFLFAHSQRLELGTSGSLGTALYHCATATSGFHLWQFQVLKSGAEGLVVVLFWLDPWKIFFFLHQALNWGPLDL